MKAFLHRFSPPGMPLRPELYTVLFSNAGAALYGLIRFLSDYTYARGNLFVIQAGKQVLRQGAVIVEFRTLIQGCFSGFAVAAALVVGNALLRYAYFHRGAKSVYTVRRLPEKAPVLRRVLPVPALELLLTGAAAILLLLLCAAIYRIFTPESSLPPQAWSIFWRGHHA